MGNITSSNNSVVSVKYFQDHRNFNNLQIKNVREVQFLTNAIESYITHLEQLIKGII